MEESKNNLRGCYSEKFKDTKYCNTHSCNPLNIFDKYKNIPPSANATDIVEVRFKNTTKAFFRNVNQLKLEAGDVIAVEASPGHDIGTVSLTGELVLEQMRKKNINPNSELKKIYRKVKDNDIEKWGKAISREDKVMYRSRKIAKSLNLNMKIGDVEFQGDGTKAIFYYIADERVDFRQLIRVLADEFKIRIEMRQIGARQEAGRIGGIGSCGRELCCSSWMTNFASVSTDTAREQEISLNPQKLAGQCGKLKCCLNFEIKTYKDTKNSFPAKVVLNTKEGTAYYQKMDVFKRLYWYSFSKTGPENITGISVDRVAEILELNKKGVLPETLKDKEAEAEAEIMGFQNDEGEDSITRFDKKKKKTRKRKRKPINTNNKNKADYSKKTNSNNRNKSNSDKSKTENNKKQDKPNSQNQKSRNKNYKKPVNKQTDKKNIDNKNTETNKQKPKKKNFRKRNFRPRNKKNGNSNNNNTSKE